MKSYSFTNLPSFLPLFYLIQKEEVNRERQESRLSQLSPTFLRNYTSFILLLYSQKSTLFKTLFIQTTLNSKKETYYEYNKLALTISPTFLQSLSAE